MVGFITGPIEDPVALQDTPWQATPGEVISDSLGQDFAGNKIVQGVKAIGRSLANSGLPASPEDALGRAFAGQPAIQPPPDQMQRDDANKAYPGLNFTSPVSQSVAQSLYDDHQAAQRRAETISRNGDSILSGSVARTGLSLLTGLLDPLNIAAGVVPVLPEAFVAEKLAAAGESFLARTAVRAGTGAVEGAAGMAALEPLNAAFDASEHNDWSMSEALRNIAFGATIGAGLHATLGGLFGDRIAGMKPEDKEAVLKTGIAQAIDDRPVEPAMAALIDTLPSEPPGIVAYHGSAHSFDRFDRAHIGSGEGTQLQGHGFYLAEDPKVADLYRIQMGDGSHLYQTRVRVDPSELMDWDRPISEQPKIAAKLEAAGIPVPDDTTTGEQLHDAMLYENGAAWDTIGQADQVRAADRLQAAGIRGIRSRAGEATRADTRRNLTIFNPDDIEITHRNGEPVSATGEPWITDPQQAAADLVQAARNPPQRPEVVQARALNEQMEATAPKVEGDVDQQITELQRLHQDTMDQVKAEIDGGRLHPETLSGLPAHVADIEAEGKAMQQAAACMMTRGF